MPGSTWTRIAFDHPKFKAVVYEFIDTLIPGDMFSMNDLLDYLATVPMHRYRRPAGRNRNNPIPIGTRGGYPNFNMCAKREWLADSGTYFAQVVMSHPFLFRGSFRSAKSDGVRGGPDFNAHQVFYCKTDEAWNWVCVLCESDYQVKEGQVMRLREGKDGSPRCFRRLIECEDCYERYRFADENLEDLV